ncbi:MAG: AAA family ATPase [Thiotrichales bacterium]|nr:MAG: AAA family ATPase [Thiotrichales bacterium]
MRERQITPHFKRLATQYPVITLTGPRQSGKTTLCKHVFPQYDYVNLEDPSVRLYANEDPKAFLGQFKNGVILDEIQRAPDLTSYIQVIVDEKQTPGQFILTGSQQFEVTHTINQSLAGRTALLKLLPLSYEEAYDNQGVTSLDDVLYKGFYPRIFDKNLPPTEALSFYLNTYIERDLRDMAQIRDLLTFQRFLKLCATQVGQLLNCAHLANDCGVSQNTIKFWLSLLEASYIIYFIQPHYHRFRKRLTKSPKLYFYDVGLASYLLGITNSSHIASHPSRGHLFENFIVTEFIKNCFNNVQEKNTYFFRDHVGNEVDLILDYGTELVSVEIKSSQTINSSAFQGLGFYKKLAKTQNTKQLLIYAGNEKRQQNGAFVFPYTQLNAVFDHISS